MEFTFSDEQEQLRRVVRDFMTRDAPMSFTRSMMDNPSGLDDAQWTKLADLGWPGLLVPVDHGGLGLAMVDLVVVMEEMGRVAFAGPYLSSSVIATLAALRLGLHERLPALASGATRATVALEEQGHGDVVDRVRTRASRKTGRWLLSGIKPVVLDAQSADWMLVVARTQEGLGSFLIDAPGAIEGLVEMVPTWDLTRRVGRVSLQDVPGEPVGPVGDHTHIWRRVVDDTCVALCAELIGVMEAANDLAVEYAKARVQFDRPIATFQAIKHKCADMLQRQELSRVGTHYAAWASDVEDPVRAEAAAMAKAYVPESANFVTAECIQIHGGVGFTWDCDGHIFYKRAKQNDLMLGYHGIHRERVADSYLSTAS